MKPALPATFSLLGVVLSLACIGAGVALVVRLVTPGPARLRVERRMLPECGGLGYLVRGGRDWDRSGALGVDEAETMAVVCAVDGRLEPPSEQEELDGAFDSSDEPRHPLPVFLGFEDETPGEPCPTGGLRVGVGVDRNRDGGLTADEVTDFDTLCDPGEGLDPAAVARTL